MAKRKVDCMDNKYFIGIDSGTSGIKAVLFYANGEQLEKAYRPLNGIFPEENQYEEDMTEIWQKCKECIKELSESYDLKNVSGIGITAQGDGLWMLDKDGNPVRNGICFCDGRAGDIVDEWVSDGTVDKLFDLTGTRIFSGNQNGIVKWMQRNEPASLDKSAYLMHLKDYLFLKLTGHVTTDATDQSLIFLNQNTRNYSDEVFKLCKLEEYREKYPPILPAKENAFYILPYLAEQLGFSKEVLVTSGPMDVSACALGSGVVDIGDCCTIMGTAALHEMVISKPLQDNIHAGMTITHVMPNRWLRLMASLAGTPNLDWMIKTFGAGIKIEAKNANMNIYDYMENMIKNVPIGANGIIYHPYLLPGGERAPFTDSAARASYTGISSRHTLADIIRATYEGVAYAMVDCYQHMPQAINNLTLCGGGTKSAFWSQMFADAVGHEIITVKGEEAGAKGVVLNNCVVQGYYKDYKDAVEKTVEIDKKYIPDCNKHKEYMRFYKLYKKTYDSIHETWRLRKSLIGE